MRNGRGLLLDQMEVLHGCTVAVDTWRKVKLGRLDKMVEEKLFTDQGTKIDGGIDNDV